MCSVAPRTSGDSRSRRAATGAPASPSTTLTPTERSSVLFPDMFEPLTTSTRGAASRGRRRFSRRARVDQRMPQAVGLI